MFALKQLRFHEYEGQVGGWVPVAAVHPPGALGKLPKFLAVHYSLVP